MADTEAAADLLTTIDTPNDIVCDVLSRVVDSIAFVPASILLEIEAGVRRDWGGERPYIAKSGEAGRAERTRRECAIRDEHRRGYHAKALARKWGLSMRRIQQIVKG